MIKGLYAIIDSSYIPLEEMGRTASLMAEGGVNCIQLRGKGFTSRELLKAARIIREVTKGVTFIVNDRVDVAIVSKADGVHLGQDDLPVEEARRLLGKDKTIGLSTHNMEEALEAARLNVDYISFGPIFPTTTKPDAREPMGLENLRKVKARVNIPVVAIGGIKEENLPSVLSTGVDGVAIISDILTSGDIKGKIRRLSLPGVRG
ncbi:MAG: thiamine phosphate synthase [Deltaproteobacteria bacterium]|nr:thiamine phosphate synthase [Deltaproteobacteria bacterium]